MKRKNKDSKLAEKIETIETIKLDFDEEPNEDKQAELEEKIEEIEEKVKKKKDSRVKAAVSAWMESYGKIAGAALVVAVLVAVSIASVATRMAEKRVGVGVMMTLSDVARKKPAFNDKTFVVAGITYNDMITSNYETDQLAQLEKTEKQIDEILSAKRQNRKDQAAYEALTAVHTVVTDGGDAAHQLFVASTPEVTETVTVTTTPTAATQIIADENGTYQYLGEFKLTAYCPCPICCGKWSNMVNPITASGKPAVQGWSIAADRKYPFGTKMMFNGQIYSVEDRGGAIVGNHIDVYFNNHQDALAFGCKTASVYMVIE